MGEIRLVVAFVLLAILLFHLQRRSHNPSSRSRQPPRLKSFVHRIVGLR